MDVGEGYYWHSPSDCGRCGLPESYHHWQGVKSERGATGQAAWEASPWRHDYEAPSEQMRKERIKARIIMEQLSGRRHKVVR